MELSKEEIIRMAREAGFEVVDGQLQLYFDGSKALLKPNYIGTVVDGLKEFATIVAAHEREACAKVCETDEFCCKCGDECAAAIRNRSNAS